MKFEILRTPDNKMVAMFTVHELSLLSFPEWKSSPVVEMSLTDFATKCATINLVDEKSQTPLTAAPSVEFYLPEPLIEQMLSALTLKGIDVDQARTPTLTQNAILAAIVEDLKHNHLPNERYTMRISE